MLGVRSIIASSHARPGRWPLRVDRGALVRSRTVVVVGNAPVVRTEVRRTLRASSSARPWTRLASPGSWPSACLGVVKHRPSVVRLPGVHSRVRCRPLRPGAARHRACSALVVSHHLDGFLLRGARSLVACCSRPWGSPGFGPRRAPLRAVSCPRHADLVPPLRCCALRSLPHPCSRARVTASLLPPRPSAACACRGPRGLAPPGCPLRPTAFPRWTARCSLGLSLPGASTRRLTLVARARPPPEGAVRARAPRCVPSACLREPLMRAPPCGVSLTLAGSVVFAASSHPRGCVSP
jgi:hypothetical protein